MERREFLKKGALTGAALALGSRIPILSSASADSSSPLTASCLWGVHCEPRTMSSTSYSAIQSLEEKIGRRFAVDRQYRRFNNILPTSYMRWTSANGRTPYVSWNSYYTTGSPVSWARIADGVHDDWIRQQALSIKGWGQHMYLTFNHEPENDAGRSGSAYDYRRAFNHIMYIFEGEGVANVTWVATLMAPTFSGRNGGPHSWLPAQYDMIGVDGYNRWPCFWENGRKGFGEIFTPAHSFAVAAGKPMAIGEYGTLEATSCGNNGDPGAKAKWFQTAAAFIQSWPEVKWAAYSHVYGTFRGRPMPFFVNTSGAALSSFTEVGQTPYFF